MVSSKTEKILKCDAINWKNIHDLQLSKDIMNFEPIITRIEEDAIESMKKEAKEENNV